MFTQVPSYKWIRVFTRACSSCIGRVKGDKSNAAMPPGRFSRVSCKLWPVMLKARFLMLGRAAGAIALLANAAALI